MKTGTIKWFDATKGFGFITPNDGGPELFMHGSRLEASGIASVSAGDVVSYEESTRSGKTSATNLTLVSRAAEVELAAAIARRAREPERASSSTGMSLEEFEREWALKPVR